MNNLSEWIFEHLNDLFQLYGDSWANLMDKQQYYGWIGLWAFIIAIIFAGFFYFWPSAKIHGRGKWFGFMFLNFIVALFFERFFSEHLFNSTVSTEEEVAELMAGVISMDFWGISIYAAIIAVAWYVICSFIPCCWISTHNYKVPINK